MKMEFHQIRNERLLEVTNLNGVTMTSIPKTNINALNCTQRTMLSD